MRRPLARPACARCATWRMNWRTGGHKRMLAVKMAQIVMPWEFSNKSMVALAKKFPPDYPKIYIAGRDGVLYQLKGATLV